MAIKVNQNTFTERKLYTGLIDYDVVGINPGVDQLAEFFNKDASELKEPNYTSEDEEGSQLRLEIWLRNEEFGLLTKVVYWLRDAERIKADGTKNQYINGVGQSSWGVDENSLPDWFDTTGLRQAMVGEGDLYNFLLAWSNANIREEGAEFALETSWSDLVGGDVSELVDFAETFGETQVRMLTGVKAVNDKHYQTIYANIPLKAGSNYVKKLDKNLSNYAWKNVSFQDSYAVKEFIPGVSSEQPAEESAPASVSNEELANLLKNG